MGELAGSRLCALDPSCDRRLRAAAGDGRPAVLIALPHYNRRIRRRSTRRRARAEARMEDIVAKLTGSSDPTPSSPATRYARARPAGCGRGPTSRRRLVRPRTTEEVSRTLRICWEAHQPVVPQGGLTGLVGGARPERRDRALARAHERRSRRSTPPPHDDGAGRRAARRRPAGGRRARSASSRSIWAPAARAPSAATSPPTPAATA